MISSRRSAGSVHSIAVADSGASGVHVFSCRRFSGSIVVVYEADDANPNLSIPYLVLSSTSDIKPRKNSMRVRSNDAIRKQMRLQRSLMFSRRPSWATRGQQIIDPLGTPPPSFPSQPPLEVVAGVPMRLSVKVAARSLQPVSSRVALVRRGGSRGCEEGVDLTGGWRYGCCLALLVALVAVAPCGVVCSGGCARSGYRHVFLASSVLAGCESGRLWVSCMFRLACGHRGGGPGRADTPWSTSRPTRRRLRLWTHFPS